MDSIVTNYQTFPHYSVTILTTLFVLATMSSLWLGYLLAEDTSNYFHRWKIGILLTVGINSTLSVYAYGFFFKERLPQEKYINEVIKPYILSLPHEEYPLRSVTFLSKQEERVIAEVTFVEKKKNVTKKMVATVREGAAKDSVRFLRLSRDLPEGFNKGFYNVDLFINKTIPRYDIEPSIGIEDYRQPDLFDQKNDIGNDVFGFGIANLPVFLNLFFIFLSSGFSYASRRRIDRNGIQRDLEKKGQGEENIAFMSDVETDIPSKRRVIRK